LLRPDSVGQLAALWVAWLTVTNPVMPHRRRQALQTLEPNRVLTFSAECMKKVLRGNNPFTKLASMRSQATCQALVKAATWCAGLRKPITKPIRATPSDCPRVRRRWTDKLLPVVA
jgi:hypothetical protein